MWYYMEYDFMDFYDIWKFSPIYLVLFRYTRMRLRFSDIKAELPDCKVADIVNNNEFYEDMIKHSSTILDDSKGDSNITEYKKGQRDLLQRFLYFCKISINIWAGHQITQA